MLINHRWLHLWHKEKTYLNFQKSESEKKELKFLLKKSKIFGAILVEIDENFIWFFCWISYESMNETFGHVMDDRTEQQTNFVFVFCLLKFIIIMLETNRIWMSDGSVETFVLNKTKQKMIVKWSKVEKKISQSRSKKR